MDVFQTRFGPIEVDPQSVLEFPLGLPGFEDCRHYKLLHEENPNPQVMWLQSLDNPSLAFSVVEANRLGLNYQIVLSDEETALIGLESTDDVALLLMLLRPDGEMAAVSANAQSPLVINVKTRKGLQKTDVRADIVFRNV